MNRFSSSYRHHYRGINWKTVWNIRRKRSINFSSQISPYFCNEKSTTTTDIFHLKRGTKLFLTQRRERSDDSLYLDNKKETTENIELKNPDPQFYEVLKDCRAEEIKGNYKVLQKLSMKLLKRKLQFSPSSQQTKFTFSEEDNEDYNELDSSKSRTRLLF